MNVPQPKGGLTVTFSKDAPRNVEKTVQHLEQLSVEASAPMEVVSKPSEATTIKAELQPAEDPDLDLETGEIRRNPHSDASNLWHRNRNKKLSLCTAYNSRISKCNTIFHLR